MKNQVIEVLDRDHGRNVIEYWKSKGVDTSVMLGIRTKKKGDLFRYYGVIDDYFNIYSEEQVVANNAEIIQLPKDKMYNKILNDMKNKVIEVLDLEHGNKVIEYWKSKGVDTRCLDGNNTKERENAFRYYGVIGGYFGCYSIAFVKEANAEIIELPEENPFPRVMFVSNDGNEWYKRVVFMKKCDRYLAWNKAKTIEESESISSITAWRYAKEIEPKQRTITLSDLNSKIEDIKRIFGIGENEDVIIKLD